MYNVLEKLRSGEPLNDKDQPIHEQGLVSILKQIHDDLDAAVFDAYGWPPDLSDEEILERLVALNAERAAEEANGHVRWLRPDYQAPDEYAAAQAAKPVQGALIDVDSADSPPAAAVPAEKRAWPTTLAEQAQAVRAVLMAFNAPVPMQGVTVRDVAAAFTGRATKKRIGSIEALLYTLVALGQAEASDGTEAVRYRVMG